MSKKMVLYDIFCYKIALIVMEPMLNIKTYILHIVYFLDYMLVLYQSYFNQSVINLIIYQYINLSLPNMSLCQFISISVSFLCHFVRQSDGLPVCLYMSLLVSKLSVCLSNSLSFSQHVTLPNFHYYLTVMESSVHYSLIMSICQFS